MVAKLVSKIKLLQEYVITACFKKMLRRMENKLSLPYIEAIASFSDFQFKETHLKPKQKERNLERMFGEVLVSLNKAKRLDTTITNCFQLPSLTTEMSSTPKTRARNIIWSWASYSANLNVTSGN